MSWRAGQFKHGLKIMGLPGKFEAWFKDGTPEVSCGAGQFKHGLKISSLKSVEV